MIHVDASVTSRSNALKSREIRGVLLDLDETIHSRETAFWTWLESEARRVGTVLERDRIAELDARGRGDKSRLLEYLGSIFDWEQSHERRMARFRNGLAAHVRLAPGVRELLARLARQYRVGLITNGIGETQRAKLSSLQIEQLFDPIIISGEVGFTKPDQRIFQLGIAGWGLSAESVLFVGDDPIADIQGARAAGLQALPIGSDGIPSILMIEAWLDNQ